MNEVRIGDNFIRCWPEQQHICTVLPDGSEVPASPNHTEEDVARASELGYASTWEMSRDHEAMHTYLAHRLGLPYSPTLWWVAHQATVPMTPAMQERFAAEEAMVMEFQRVLTGRESPGPLAALWLPEARAIIATLLGRAA